jgi:hypothetical protein
MSEPTDEVKALVEKLAKWVAKNAERESIFLTPRPHYLVDAHALLDFVRDESGVEESQITAWVDEARRDA